jgi:hypothetical protein
MPRLVQFDLDTAVGKQFRDPKRPESLATSQFAVAPSRPESIFMQHNPTTDAELRPEAVAVGRSLLSLLPPTALYIPLLHVHSRMTLE